MTERRILTPEDMVAMQNGRPAAPPQAQEEKPEPEQQEQPEQQGEFEVPRHIYESIGRQYMQEHGPVPMRQQISQMAGEPAKGEALVEWSKGTMFGISIGVCVGAGIAYLVVRNYLPPEENASSGD